MNGKPGDDPILDITHYKRPVFSPTIDGLIVQIVDLGGRLELEVKLVNLASAPLQELEAELRALRDKYKQNARQQSEGVD
jgi:hypothetical protein